MIREFQSSVNTLYPDNPNQYKVGYEIEWQGKTCLITRIVNSTSFFEDHQTHETYTIEELYVELLTRDQQIKFIPIREVKHPFVRDFKPTIGGPDTLPWKKVINDI